MRTKAGQFWSKVAKPNEQDDCWEWTACRHPEGYGQFQGKRAHRVVWEMLYGPIEKGLCICHHCDNPGCVNPRHLFKGSCAENSADAVAKGRFLHGPAHHNTKLTARLVRKLRKLNAAGESHCSLARRFGYGATTVRYACNRVTWRHVP